VANRLELNVTNRLELNVPQPSGAANQPCRSQADAEVASAPELHGGWQARPSRELLG
jgi:hypothetical protein